MNLVWIEDFGGNLPSNANTLEALFKGIEKEGFFDQWDNHANLTKKPTELEEYFKRNSRQNKVWLSKDFFQFEEFQNSIDIIREIDIFIIDIRLDNKVDLQKAVPAGFSSSKEFHEKAGFNIYNTLLHSGFPSKNICFLTGEGSTFAEFETHCKKARMPVPENFEKGDKGFCNIRSWLEIKRKDSALILRRAVIQGCLFLKTICDSKAILNEFLRKDRAGMPERSYSRQYLEGYLETLIRISIKLFSHDKNTNQQYQIFARTLAHEWENSMSPLNLPWDKQRSFLFPFGLIMKHLRNWLAHGNLLNSFSEADIAFFFLINMRALFDLGNTLLPYESQLLSLFPSKEMGYSVKFTEGNLRSALLNSYVKLKKMVIEKRLKNSMVGDGAFFNELADILHRNQENGLDYKKILFQMFWHAFYPIFPAKNSPLLASDSFSIEYNVSPNLSKLESPLFLKIFAHHFFPCSFAPNGRKNENSK